MDAIMRGLVVHAYGDWRGLRLETIPVPRPGPDEVLIAAEAAALNFPDALMIAGKYQHRPPVPFIPGRDVAGTVIAVGCDVHGFAAGDRVVAQPRHGAFATHVVAPQHYCVKIPTNVSSIDAAASGTVLATVVAALGVRAQIRPGEVIVITGAAGGVGSAAIQYAIMRGGRVAAIVSSAEKEAAVRALGAEFALRTDKIPNLRDGLRAALHEYAPAGADILMDVVGGDVFDAAIRCVRPGGRGIIVGFASGRIPTVATNYLLLKDIALIGSSLDRLFSRGDAAFKSLLVESFEAVADGRIKIPIENCYPLCDFALAMARIVDRQVVGKVVLSPMA